MMNIMNPPADWSTLKKLIWLRGTPINGGEELTVSGTPPLSLPNSLGKPLKAWSVDLSPYQDLHGYDNPWPAGGGVNKFDEQVSLGLLNSDGSISQTDERLVTGFIPVEAGKEYAFVWPTNVSRGRGAFYDSSKNLVQYFNDFPSDTSHMGSGYGLVTAPTGAAFLRINLTSLYGTTYNHDISVNYPSSVTTYTPYSNICPIYGTDKLTIYTDSKYGGLVEWNQIQRFDVRTSISEGVTYTLNNDGSISCSGTSTGNSYINIGNTIDNVLNHVLYIRGCPSGGSASTFYYRDGYNANSDERDIGNGRITKGKSRFVGQIAILEGTDATGLVFKPQCFDLTKMFGATKADEIYAMEQAEAGTGIAYFRSLFPNDYYAYDAGGTLKTVDQVNGAQYTPAVLTLPTLSANQWDEEWEVGAYNVVNGRPATRTDAVRCKNPIPVKPDTEYYIYGGSRASSSGVLLWYDSEDNYISYNTNVINAKRTAPSNAKYLRFYVAPETVINNDFAINYPSTVTTYNPYNATVYTGTIGSEGGESRDEEIDLATIDPTKWHFGNALSDGTGYYVFITGTVSNPTTINSDRYARTLVGSWEALSFGQFMATTYLIITVPNECSTLESAKDYLLNTNKPQFVVPISTSATFAVPSVTIPTPIGTATTWATAEDGTVESMKVTYVGKA